MRSLFLVALLGLPVIGMTPKALSHHTNGRNPVIKKDSGGWCNIVDGHLICTECRIDSCGDGACIPNKGVFMDYSVKQQKSSCDRCGFKYKDTGWYNPTSNHCYDYDFKRERKTSQQRERVMKSWQRVQDDKACDYVGYRGGCGKY